MEYDFSVIYFPDGDQNRTFQQITKLCEHYKTEILQGASGTGRQSRRRELPEILSSLRGQYFTVVSEGDLLPEDYFAKVREIADKKDAPEIISFWKQYNSLRGRKEEIFSAQREKDQILDMSQSASVFPVMLNGTFIKNTPRNRSHFSDKGEDTEKNGMLRLLREKQIFAYVGTQKYVYSNADEDKFPDYPGIYQEKWYLDSLQDFLIPLMEESSREQEEIPAFIQQYALYALQCRLEANKNNRNKHVLDETKTDRMLALFHRILSMVEDRYITGRDGVQGHFDWEPERVRMLLRLKYDNPALDFDYAFHPESVDLLWLGEKVDSLNRYRVNIEFMDYRKGRLEIDVSVPDFFSADSLQLQTKLDEDKYLMVPSQEYAHTKFFGRSAYKRSRYHVSVPIPAEKKVRYLYFTICSGAFTYIIAPEFESHYSRLSTVTDHSYWSFGSCMAQCEGDKIRIRHAGKLALYRQELGVWIDMLRKKNKVAYLQLIFRSLYFLWKPLWRRKRIWLFLDKIYKAGDSSEYLYKYASAQIDGIKKYYLVDKNSPDYGRLKAEGFHPLVRGTWKHHVLFLCADMVVISNSTLFAFNDYSLKKSAYIRDLVNFHVVCVQHGMSVQKIAVAQRRLRDNTRLYFCASKYEIENLSKPVYGYAGHDVLRLTGVPRYDGLKDRAGKMIMISPTWRMQAAMTIQRSEAVERDYNPDFCKTDYYKVFNSLINDRRLLEAARESGYRIAYVLHPIVSPQARDFERNDLVDIIPSTGGMSYEKMLCEASLMVTDYSGIQFDFAYMRKPVVYLHHRDIPQHYEEGTFHYDTMAFGEICHDNEELITLLCDYMKQGCKMKPEFRRRADDFFYYNDHSNCQRVYDEMLHYQKEVADQCRADR